MKAKGTRERGHVSVIERMSNYKMTVIQIRKELWARKVTTEQECPISLAFGVSKIPFLDNQ